MRKILYLGVAALLGASTSMASAAPTVVNVNIAVTPIISMWAGHSSINLVMDGSDPGANNLASFPSYLAVVNNVDARIEAQVTGTLPADLVPGGGIHFHIFDTADPVAVAAAVGLNAYNPGGAQSWNNTNLGDTKTVIASTGLNPSTNVPTYAKPITYASTSPGEVPDVGSYNLVVTYTIIQNP